MHSNASTAWAIKSNTKNFQNGIPDASKNKLVEIHNKQGHEKPENYNHCQS